MEVNDDNNCYYCGCPIPDWRHFCAESTCKANFFAIYGKRGQTMLAMATRFRRKHDYPHFKTALDVEREIMEDIF